MGTRRVPRRWRPGQSRILLGFVGSAQRSISSASTGSSLRQCAGSALAFPVANLVWRISRTIQYGSQMSQRSGWQCVFRIKQSLGQIDAFVTRNQIF